MGASPIVERLLGNQVSDTTLRDRRDEAIAAGVFEHLADEAVAGYDRGIGLDFSECSVDGSQHKAPAGGEGTGTSPVDRGKRGWKWSLFADRHGIPLMTTNVPQPLEASTPRWRGISHLALITADMEQPSASTTMSSEPDSWPRSASRSSERGSCRSGRELRNSKSGASYTGRQFKPSLCKDASDLPRLSAEVCRPSHLTS